MTVRTREPTCPSLVLVSVAVSMRCVRPMWRETARARIEAIVMTPRPPMAMPTRITDWPNADQ